MIRSKMLQYAVLMLGFATLSAQECHQEPHRDPQVEAEKREQRENQKAKEIAAVEVRGEATAARRVDLNGATGGWEVIVRVDGDKPQLWRVLIDRDTWAIRSKKKL